MPSSAGTRVTTRSSSPPTPGTQSEPGLIVYRFGVGLFYANAARLSEEVNALIDTDPPPRWFVLLAEAIDDVDYTGGKTLCSSSPPSSQSRNVVFAIAEAGPDVRRELDRFGVTAKIGESHLFDTADEARAAFRSARAPDG